MQFTKDMLSRKKSLLAVIGILILLLGAFALLWSGRVNSNQAMNAMMAQVYFDGEYRIGDGPWQEIIDGEHIPSTKGDVTLRGNFHMLTPDGEYIGIYSDQIPIAFYINHISLTFYEGENVFQLLRREAKANKIHMEFEETPIYNSAYIEGIHNLYEFDCGELSGWMYRVNGWYPNSGCSRYQLKEGDQVEWIYTCDLGRDIGGRNVFD